MPNQKISASTAAAALDGTELVPVVQSSLNKRTTTASIAALATASAVTETGVINVLDYTGIVNDGETDCQNGFAEFRGSLANHGSGFKQTVTITIASPAVITLADHGFTLNDPVIFSTTGALPTGLVAGTTYWLTSENLTTSTFSVTTDNQSGGVGELPSIVTSGSQSGVHSVQLQGHDWLNVLIPSGNYHMSGNGRIITNTGIKKANISGSGAVFDIVAFANDSIGVALDETSGNGTCAYINSVAPASLTITVTTLADISKFVVNGWIAILALDLQGEFSGPPNNHYFEFKKVANINTGTGVITFNSGLRNGYKSTYPIGFAGDVSHIPTGGAATAYALNPCWDMELIVNGLRCVTASQVVSSTRKMKFIDFQCDGQGLVPSLSQYVTHENCTWFGTVEVDKLVELLTYVNCTFSTVQVQSSSVEKLVFDGCNAATVSGTTRKNEIRNCNIGSLSVGPLLFGQTESLYIENSIIGDMASSMRLDDGGGASDLRNLVHRWTFSAGRLSFPKANGAIIWWAVPGARMFFNGIEDALNTNRGSPFVILDVYEDATNNYIDTTLTTIPSGNSTNSVVTITITSPAVVTWALHGLVAGTPVIFITTDTLPTGIDTTQVYYVIAAGLGANSFQFSATVGGSAVNTSGTQAGTHTAISKPLHFQPHPCPRMTVRNSTGCAIVGDHSGAPDDMPMFSYARRSLVGNASADGPGVNIPKMLVWGKITSLTVNVTRAYTGVTNPLTLAMTATGYDASLVASAFAQTIDLRTTGLRTITQTAATGGVGADVIAAYADWLSGLISMQTSADQVGTFEKTAIVDVEITTDQGITKVSPTFFSGPASLTPSYNVDTAVIAPLG